MQGDSDFEILKYSACLLLCACIVEAAMRAKRGGWGRQ